MSDGGGAPTKTRHRWADKNTGREPGNPAGAKGAPTCWRRKASGFLLLFGYCNISD